MQKFSPVTSSSFHPRHPRSRNPRSKCSSPARRAAGHQPFRLQDQCRDTEEISAADDADNTDEECKSSPLLHLPPSIRAIHGQEIPGVNAALQPGGLPDISLSGFRISAGILKKFQPRMTLITRMKNAKVLPCYIFLLPSAPSTVKKSPE